MTVKYRQQVSQRNAFGASVRRYATGVYPEQVHCGVTDTPGGRRARQDAAGHKDPSMTDVYSHELDVYDPAGIAG